MLTWPRMLLAMSKCPSILQTKRRTLFARKKKKKKVKPHSFVVENQMNKKCPIKMRLFRDHGHSQSAWWSAPKPNRLSKLPFVVHLLVPCVQETAVVLDVLDAAYD